MAQFLLRAQDHNMTNGDFAFFTLRPASHSGTDRPWTGYLKVSEDLPRRLQAFYAVKQVRAYYLRLVTFQPSVAVLPLLFCRSVLPFRCAVVTFRCTGR